MPDFEKERLRSRVEELQTLVDRSLLHPCPEFHSPRDFEATERHPARVLCRARSLRPVLQYWSGILQYQYYKPSGAAGPADPLGVTDCSLVDTLGVCQLYKSINF